ncbi:pirin family protein [Methylomicrobium sp. RS1]|uniref:pirin family protein n=1 Tax=Candidatus Methylomicrobium oryzae TaxID=2802053 RepID=UPI001922D7E6|nr:pirin family protein [Methylomicrobium sp. RS1]MBL1263451.1 pirin family protein [Methylomicrobium sp. RS1]
MSTRTLKKTINALPATDGGGVKLLRSLGQSQSARLDPFLMLDEFSSANADDYSAGFPDHPHRGFETVTYMLEGHMLHRDHLGNRGDLKSGSVQWMTAGRGIIHSEMPQQESGRMRGFQLWVNLPAREKMKPAAYRDIQPEAIPLLALQDGSRVKVIAGSAQAEGRVVAGPVQGLSTEPLFLDVHLPANGHFDHPVAEDHNAFVYLYEGSAEVGPTTERLPLAPHAAGVLSEGNRVEVHAGKEGASFLMLAAKPLREPVVQYGPFVMNTRDEIEQALADYRDGQLV